MLWHVLPQLRQTPITTHEYCCHREEESTLIGLVRVTLSQVWIVYAEQMAEFERQRAELATSQS